jgi:hypothetical protein
MTRWIFLTLVLYGGQSAAQANSPLAQLLLSGAWCTFTYNKTTGYSHSSRYEFLSNGTWRKGSRGEGGSSGPYGSIASQRSSGSGGGWGVQNGMLYMSEGYGPLQPVNTQVSTNSSGNPIIRADGAEYSRCN